MKNIQTKTPGKLYIAGEYAVVEPGYSAIISAIDLFIYVKIQESNQPNGSFYSEGFTKKTINWQRQNNVFTFYEQEYNLNYVLSAIQTTEEYLAEISVPLKFYHLNMNSELDSLSNKKLGLGSSGAATVGIIQSLLDFYEVAASDLLVFKLSVLSQLRLGVHSSFGDLAASAYTGWIKYTNFDRKFIEKQLKEDSIKKIVELKWPNLKIKKLNVSPNVQLMIGWTGSPASSDELVGTVQKRKTQAKENYQHFLVESTKSVECLEDALTHFNKKKVIGAVNRNRKALFQMGQETNISIETAQLSKLIEIAERHFAVAKTSGAGGGDSGIAFIFDATNQAKIVQEWKQVGIVQLPLNVFEK